MPYLYELAKDKKQTDVLLAADVLDASKGALFGEQTLTPDDNNRTILIGLGGTGVRTVDYVKGAIMKRLDASWRKYVSFLGVDTSWTELDGTAYLDSGEKVSLTQPGVDDRLRQYETYPAAVRRFLKDGDGAKFHGVDGDGAGRTRLVGKVKVHDQATGKLGVDEEIVSRLEKKAKSMEPMIAGGVGSYQVYVIGSVCGGTCSGSFLEMPALVHKAIPGAKVHAMLYLPDTLASLDPNNAKQLYANGYASLKELNYFMGMSMRPGYGETWSYNSNAFPELPMEGRFFDIPYLVGSNGAGALDAADTAMETIAEFLISLLGKMTAVGKAVFLTSAFESNATASAKIGARSYQPGSGDQLEAAGEFHEFPKRFAAIGFAEASAPQKVVRAYTVGHVCQKAGLMPVAKKERDALIAAGSGAIVPFRGEDDLLNATEGTAKARAVLAPVEKFLGIIHSGVFNFGEDLNEQEITWTKIRNGQYDNPAIAQKAAMVIKQRTSPEMMDDLRRKIRAAYDAYRKNVQEYVRTEGPYAFVNLYLGNFKQVNGEFGIGIERMIKNLIDGKTLDGREFRTTTGEPAWVPVETAKQNLDSARTTIANEKSAVFGIETKENKTHAAQWVQAYNNWGKARINAVRREVALGLNGSLFESFLTPAAKLTQEVGSFGRVLECLTGIYMNHGSKLNTYADFEEARDSRTEVNLAAVSAESWEWVKKQADDAWQAANAQKLRDDLVEDFFAMGEDGAPNSQKWLDVPASRVKGSDADVKLTSRDVAVPAREIFDQYLQVNFPTTLNVSVEAMFTQLQSTGKSFDDTADKIVKQLLAHSEPQFNGDIPAGSKFGFIMYPAALKTGHGAGPAIAAAIENAANVQCPGVQVYASDDADSIMFYQMAAPMEIYRLKELSAWENYYETGEYGLNNYLAFLHGMSPDLTVTSKAGTVDRYSENMPWKDYPSIVRQMTDPRTPDPKTGKVSREGQLRISLDKTIQRAKELGVLYLEQMPDAGGSEQWMVKRVHCNKATTWRFDLMECNPDPATGLLPLGKALAETVASQNGKNLEDIACNVTLEYGGVMDKPAPTRELAWEYAARVLRAHVPMYIEVRETVKKFEEWAKDIEVYNEKLKAQFLPAKMIWLVKGRVLRKNEDGTWVYIMPDGKARNVAVLTDVMKKFLPPKDKNLIDNGLLGYYLFTKLSTILTSQKAFDEAFDRARSAIERMASDAEIEALTAGEEQSAVLLAEREALAEKGARLDGDADAEPKMAFASAMTAIGVDKAKAKDIDLFYFRMGLWEVI